MITMVPGGRTNSYFGRSDDEMPTVHVPNGSVFYAFDTMEIFIYDQENQEWITQTGGA